MRLLAASQALAVRLNNGLHDLQNDRIRQLATNARGTPMPKGTQSCASPVSNSPISPEGIAPAQGTRQGWDAALYQSLEIRVDSDERMYSLLVREQNSRHPIEDRPRSRQRVEETNSGHEGIKISNSGEGSTRLLNRPVAVAKQTRGRDAGCERLCEIRYVDHPV